MLLSLIPFRFLIVPKLFGMTYTPHGYIFIITLPVSVNFCGYTSLSGVCLLSTKVDYRMLNTSIQKPWDKWIDGEVDRSTWAWTKAILLLVFGIAMLALLAEPLLYTFYKMCPTQQPYYLSLYIFLFWYLWPLILELLFRQSKLQVK